MKDLGATKKIFGMKIIREQANGTLKLSLSKYVKKILSRFNMNEAKLVSTPLGSHFKLSKEQSLKTEEEKGPYKQGALCLSYWQLNVCYGVYKARHCTYSGSYEQIHEQARKATLGGSQVDFEISEGFIRYMSLLYRCKFEIVGLCKC